MPALERHSFRCRDDNYGHLLHDAATGVTMAVDAPEAPAITAALRHKGWTLTHILVTHHHADHVAGNAALQAEFGCRIIGPAAEEEKIPGLNQTVAGGSRFSLAGRVIEVLACPGHTQGHVAYYLPQEKLVLSGDTLFALGCGRVFEGTLTEMFYAVTQFATLPAETLVLCGHDYGWSNARFALSVEPDNAALQARMAEFAMWKAEGVLAPPSTIAAERAANPFLRASSPEIRATLGMMQARDMEVFAALRQRKDGFRG